MSLGWNKGVNMLNFHVSNYISRTLRQNNTLFVTNMLPWLHDARAGPTTPNDSRQLPTTTNTRCCCLAPPWLPPTSNYFHHVSLLPNHTPQPYSPTILPGTVPISRGQAFASKVGRVPKFHQPTLKFPGYCLMSAMIKKWNFQSLHLI